MVNDHVKEWKDIMEKYEISLKHLSGLVKENIKYRVECISDLISEEEEKHE